MTRGTSASFFKLVAEVAEEGKVRRCFQKVFPNLVQRSDTVRAQHGSDTAEELGCLPCRQSMQECARLEEEEEEERQRQEVSWQQHMRHYSLRCGSLVLCDLCDRCRQQRRCADKRRAVYALPKCNPLLLRVLVRHACFAWPSCQCLHVRAGASQGRGGSVVADGFGVSRGSA